MTDDVIELSSDEDEDTTDPQTKRRERMSTDTASVSQVPESNPIPVPPVPDDAASAKPDSSPAPAVNGMNPAVHQPSPASPISRPSSVDEERASATAAVRTDEAAGIDRSADQVTAAESQKSIPERETSDIVRNPPVSDRMETPAQSAVPAGNQVDKSSLQEAGTADPRATDRRDEVRAASPSPIELAAIPSDWDPHKVRPYQCKYCYGKFLSTVLLKKHEELHEETMESTCTPFPQYECTICNRRFLYHVSRASHVLLRHPGRFIPPVVQPGTENNENKRKALPSEKKWPEKKIKTEKEEVTEKTEKVKKKESGEKTTIGDVSKPAPKKTDTGNNKTASTVPPAAQTRALRSNVDYTRDPPFEQQCSTCELLYRDPVNYQIHAPCFYQMPFRVPDGYKCPSCPDSAVVHASLYKLREHAAVHRIPPFKCSYCNIRKQLLFEMELHVLREHSDKLTS